MNWLAIFQVMQGLGLLAFLGAMVSLFVAAAILIFEDDEETP